MSDLKSKNENIITNENLDVKLLEKANALPRSSGCYFMLNREGRVIYVGKGKDLKSRVTSYFNKSSKSPKTTILVGHIRDFDFILTNSETESLVLENNLIKKHSPKYNIQLKDDKSYPYVKINFTVDFPRFEYIRRPKRNQKVVLFGPFPVGSNISKTLKTLTKLFQLRDCSIHEFNSRKEPCLLYQMKQCSAPCVSKISKEDYMTDVLTASDFFKSKRKQTQSLEVLTNKMMKYAEVEDFEQATFYRDGIEELDEFRQKSFNQDVESLDGKNIDIVSYYIGAEEIDISLYLIREGNLLGHKNFHFLNADIIINELESEVLLAVLQYYSQIQDTIPDKIITKFSKEEAAKLGKAISENFGEEVKIQVLGEVKKYKKLLDATSRHAQESQRVRIQNEDSVFVGLNRLKNLLNLKERPKLLECYDIAVWQGKSPTASQIVFYEGKPDKARYRHYHMQELPEGNNDFAMMREVFSRRLKHGNFPDVFVVDGGVQQVNTVAKVLEEMNIDISVIGIAKARDLKKLGFRSTDVKMSEERLVIQGRSNPFILNKCPSLLRIIVQMRDEAHRFSRRLHHNAENKRVIHSWIDEVKGLNNQTRELILRTNTVDKIELRKMNIGDLQNLLGLKIRHARILYSYLHAEENF